MPGLYIVLALREVVRFPPSQGVRMLKLRGRQVLMLQAVVGRRDKKESYRDKNIVFAGSTQEATFLHQLSQSDFNTAVWRVLWMKLLLQHLHECKH